MENVYENVKKELKPDAVKSKRLHFVSIGFGYFYKILMFL